MSADPARPLPLPGALFLVSTPLHALWTLAIARGRFADHRVVLARIDARAGTHDPLVDAIRELLPPPFVEVVEFPEIGKRPLQKFRNARRVMRELRGFVAERHFRYVAVGNDRRAEFYAALAESPGAIGAYLDDGTASYAPPPRRQRPFEGVGNRVRSRLYGMPTEKPDALGTARAVRDAWVLMPTQVREGLAEKRLQRIEPAWLRDPWVQAVCERAIERAGLDPRSVSGLRRLLILPHDQLLREDAALRAQFEQQARQAVEVGEPLAIKRHPRSAGLALELPREGWIDLPNRLPLEILAPLLREVRALGTYSSSLIYLRTLGANVEVAALVPRAYVGTSLAELFGSLGIAELPTTPAA